MLAQVIADGIMIGGIYALVSLGLTIIFGVMRIVNFAHGEFLMLAMYGSFWLFQLYGVDPYLSALIVVPLMFLVGLTSFRLIIKPILNASEMAHVFATLGLSIALQGLALYFWQADFRSVRPFYSSKLIDLGPVYMNLPKLIALLVAIGTIAALTLFFKKTYTGKAIRAATQNAVSAQLMGVNLIRIYMISFGIGIAVVGLAGAVLMPVFEVFPTIGSLFIMVTFVVVILGGLGSVPGALVGGMIIGLIESASGYFLAPALKEAVYFIIFVVLLLLKPTGVFGRA
ncbi:MAG: branched-chain amino acid ABC transporter permease [Deltaproteobacteria bacterium]|nr:branched-chain amino acid ABC transporter permease [Deltaproteobacteria bacterium]